MLGITTIEADALQALIDKAAAKLRDAGENFRYRNNFGISIIQLLPRNNGFELGISREAYSFGPVGNYAPALISFLTGKSETDSRIATKGVNTDGSEVKTSKLAHQHKFWYPHIRRQIRNLLDGNLGAVNAIAYPIAKHTFKDKAYKPCPTYVQYQLDEGTSTLSVVINFRAQHLSMLAFNVQLWAFQLLDLCSQFQLRLGSVFLNCTNHHIGVDQDLDKVCGAPLPWFVVPDKVSRLVRGIKAYYEEIES